MSSHQQAGKHSRNQAGNQAGDRPNDQPALFIPTYPPPDGFGADTGQARPPPAGITYYLCPGIELLGEFHPGAPLTARIHIGNWGGGGSRSLALAALWWSPPVSGQTVPDPDNFIGFASVPVPPHGGQVTTPPMTAVIDTALPHICLLAKVWHALDPAPTTLIGQDRVELADPVNERHWAQHNLMELGADGPQKLQFLATNPFSQAAVYALRIQPVARAQWPALERRLRAGAVASRVALRLTAAHGGEGRGGQGREGMQGTQGTQGINLLQAEVELKGGEQRAMTLALEPAERLPPDTFTAFEIVQLQRERPVGGLCIVMRGAQ